MEHGAPAPRPAENLVTVLRRRQGDGFAFVGRDADDARNRLDGLTITERFHVLRGVAAAMHELGSQDPQQASRQDDFLAWAGLEMFRQLRHSARWSWGRGSLGLATPRPGRRGGKAGQRRRPERLLLNLIDRRAVEPAFRGLDFAHELAGLQRRLRAKVFEAEVAFPAATLQLAVLGQVSLALGNPWGLHQVRAARARLDARRPVEVPRLAVPFTHSTVQGVLGYYGVGRGWRDDVTRYVSVRPWRLHSILDRLSLEGNVNLEEVPWLQRSHRAKGPGAERPT